MRKISEVLRLNAQGMSTRKIAPMLGISHPTIQAYLRRSLSAGLSWPLPADLSDTDLEQRLYPRPPSTAAGSFAKPDCPYIHKELRRKGVTLSLLWEEYRQGHSSGYSYSQFCVHYRCWKGHLSPVMRHTMATRLLAIGMDITDVQKFLGHEDISTTRIYAETSVAMLRRKFDQVTEAEGQKLIHRIAEDQGEIVGAFAADLLAAPNRVAT